KEERSCTIYRRFKVRKGYPIAGPLEMVGTQQAKPAKCAAADFRINRIAKPTSSRNKPILTHTTKGRLITTERIGRLKEQESRRCPLAAFPILTARNNGRYSPTQPLTITRKGYT